MAVKAEYVNNSDHLKRRRKDYWLLILTGILIICWLSLLSLSMDHPDLQNLLVVIILSYSFISALRFLFYVTGAFLFELREADLKLEGTPRVSVLLPAYNEGLVIGEVLKSFHQLDYDNFEVIVIDDGSQDATFDVAKAVADETDLDIKVFKKANAGKAIALNFGIEQSDGEFVLCMDSDSFLNPQAIRMGLRHFAKDRKLAAVAGVVRSAGKSKLINKFQQLDYLIGHLQRKILSLFGKVSIIPGPIGLFRKQAIQSVGFYETDQGTYAEDTELTFRLIAAGWKVCCEDQMMAYTETPDNYNDLMRQRYRWSRGVYQALLKNMNGFIFSQTQSNILFFIFLVWEQILVPIFDFSLLVLFVCHFLFGFDLQGYSGLILYIIFLDLVLAFLSIKKEKDLLNWMGVALLSRFSYVNILLVWKLLAFYDEWKDVKMGWDKLNRKGFVNSKVVS